MSQNIDDEWTSFLSNKNRDNSDNSDGEDNKILNKSESYGEISEVSLSSHTIPEPTDIYISTKSKIAYLRDPIDLNVFWDIPVIPYATPQNGVVKKQIKFNSINVEELNIIQEKLQKELYYEEQIITHIDNPTGRIKFKDVRKVSVGISKKDIMSCRSKKKQAFYNCFVIIIRIKINELFREFHIKIFNTGKLEIPGVQNDEIFDQVLLSIITTLQPFIGSQLAYNQTSDTVLINSNFNCGFYINREALFDILKQKYKIQAIYDPCSYPGIQCKFYYNNFIGDGTQTGIQLTKDLSIDTKNINGKKEKKNKMEKNTNITEVSFMIFRTGSVLIVGMCEESTLNSIYVFIKNILKTEFTHICQGLIIGKYGNLKEKIKKIRKKKIIIIDDQNITNHLIQTTSVSFETSDYIEITPKKSNSKNKKVGVN